MVCLENGYTPKTEQRCAIYKCNKDTGKYIMLNFLFGIVIGVIFAEKFLELFEMIMSSL